MREATRQFAIRLAVTVLAAAGAIVLLGQSPTGYGLPTTASPREAEPVNGARSKLPVGPIAPDQPARNTLGENTLGGDTLTPLVPLSEIAWDQPTGELIDPERLRRAIQLSRDYLLAACGSTGKFTYEIDLDGRAPASSRYNVLRHAGAMHALAMIHRREPRPETLDALQRAAGFLRANCVAPLPGQGDRPGQEDMLAIWSDPEVTAGTSPRQAKLGGTGLGLAALVQLEQLAPGSVPRDELRKLGRFLVFMQKPDGSFHSKYYPDRGRDDSWTSLYYPGEAALGLLLLHELDPQPAWRQAAADAIGYLARPEAWRRPVLPDHWMLLAMERLLPVYDRCRPREPRRILLAHARRTCLGMIFEQTPNRGDTLLEGCFGDDGRTAPTATRVEGLLAALNYLSPDDQAIRAKVRESAERGLLFLLRCQVREPPHAGAMPMALGPLPSSDRRAAQFNRRVRHVRIDYVQHAVCAMIQYEQLRGWRSP